MKLRPYIKSAQICPNRMGKFRVEQNGKSKTKQERLEVKNANRSLKKGYRQELKRETDKLIQTIFNKDNNEQNIIKI